MFRWIARMGAVLGLSLALLAASSAPQAQAQNTCLSWSDARRLGLIEKLNLRSAADIKAGVESKHKGKVVSFVICGAGLGAGRTRGVAGPVTYKLVVFRDDGAVINVTEPAQ